MEKLSLNTGIDMESVDRFNTERIKDRVLLNKIFTKEELDYCFSKFDPAPHLAVRFAAKEAVFKCLGGMSSESLYHKDIEILRNAGGAPFVKLRKTKPELDIKISLSHCEDRALAVAIAIAKNVKKTNKRQGQKNFR